MSQERFSNRFLVTDEGDGFETILHADGIIVVPIETLDKERKEQLDEGDYSKLLKHGGEFPGIYLLEIFEMLEDGRFDDLISACKLTRKRLDGEEMPDESPEAPLPPMTRLLTFDEMCFIRSVTELQIENPDDDDVTPLRVSSREELKGIKDKKSLAQRDILDQLISEGWFVEVGDNLLMASKRAIENLPTIQAILDRPR